MKFPIRRYLALILAGGVFGLSHLSPAYQDVMKEFTVSKGGTLSLELRAEVVQITTEEGTKVTVSAEDIRDRYREDLKITQSGNDVSVQFKPGRRNSDARFYITIPVEYNVTAEYGGGRFELFDVLKGTLDLETGGGNVELGTITGKATISTGGGNVEARSLGSDAELKTGGGHLEIDRIDGMALVRSGGGNIRLKEVGKDLKLDTGGGNVRVEKVGGKANLGTGGGNVNLGPVSAVVEASTGGGNLEIEGGRGKNMVKSGGGNIDINGMSGSVGLRTGGGNVNLELDPAGNDGSDVYSKGGDVTVALPSGAKATLDVTLNIERFRRKKYKITTDFKAEKMEVDDDGNSTALIKVNGGGQLIRVETTDGDIRIRKQ